MTVEITSIDIKEGIVTITAIDVSEENLQMLERNREDVEKEISFIFDTHEKIEYLLVLVLQHFYLKISKSYRDFPLYNPYFSSHY